MIMIMLMIMMMMLLLMMMILYCLRHFGLNRSLVKLTQDSRPSIHHGMASRRFSIFRGVSSVPDFLRSFKTDLVA